MENEPKTLEDALKILNEDIHAYGDKSITIEKLEEIMDIYTCIIALKKHGITTDTYKKKVRQYFNFAEKAFAEYGIVLDSMYPFSNPTRLWYQIEEILIGLELNEEQRKIIYKSTGMRQKSPSQSCVQEMIRSQEEWRNLSSFNKDELLSDEDFEKACEEWDALSIEEQNKELGITDEEYEKKFQYEEETRQYEEERARHLQKIKKLNYTKK